VRYVPSPENRSHGASLGARLEPFCNGTRFRYVYRRAAPRRARRASTDL
jgi:hypothetical protein